MRILVCDINLFSLNQEIDIYEGQKNIANEIIHTSAIKDAIPELVKKYNVDKVNLYGMESFAIGIKDAIEKNPYEYSKKVVVRIIKK